MYKAECKNIKLHNTRNTNIIKLLRTLIIIRGQPIHVVSHGNYHKMLHSIMWQVS